MRDCRTKRIAPTTAFIVAGSSGTRANFRAVLTILFMLTGWSLAGTAAPAQDAFKGKTINVIVAAGEGGGFDIAARVTARHLARFLPGRPTIVVQNMPGANGIRAAEYIYRIAPRDGSTIAVLQPLMMLNKVLDPSARYEPQELTWIGRMNPSPTFGVSWHTAPVSSVVQARTTKLTLAAGGPLGPAWIIPQALNRLAGTHFAPIKGYPSATDQGLAMERGEVEGMGSASEEYLQDRGWLDQRLVNVIYTVGRERRPRAPDAPTVLELMDSELHLENADQRDRHRPRFRGAAWHPAGVRRSVTARIRPDAAGP
jgi:tripartite-type tricarboxylate transporter receptor subunit TctC